MKKLLIGLLAGTMLSTTVATTATANSAVYDAISASVVADYNEYFGTYYAESFGGLFGVIQHAKVINIELEEDIAILENDLLVAQALADENAAEAAANALALKKAEKALMDIAGSEDLTLDETITAALDAVNTLEDMITTLRASEDALMAENKTLSADNTDLIAQVEDLKAVGMALLHNSVAKETTVDTIAMQGFHLTVQQTVENMYGTGIYSAVSGDTTFYYSKPDKGVSEIGVFTDELAAQQHFKNGGGKTFSNGDVFFDLNGDLNVKHPTVDGVTINLGEQDFSTLKGFQVAIGDAVGFSTQDLLVQNVDDHTSWAKFIDFEEIEYDELLKELVSWPTLSELMTDTPFPNELGAIWQGILGDEKYYYTLNGQHNTTGYATASEAYAAYIDAANIEVFEGHDEGYYQVNGYIESMQELTANDADDANSIWYYTAPTPTSPEENTITFWQAKVSPDVFNGIFQGIGPNAGWYYTYNGELSAQSYSDPGIANYYYLEATGFDWSDGDSYAVNIDGVTTKGFTGELTAYSYYQANASGETFWVYHDGGQASVESLEWYNAYVDAADQFKADMYAKYGKNPDVNPWLAWLTPQADSVYINKDGMLVIKSQQTNEWVTTKMTLANFFNPNGFETVISELYDIVKFKIPTNTYINQPAVEDLIGEWHEDFTGIAEMGNKFKVFKNGNVVYAYGDLEDAYDGYLRKVWKPGKNDIVYGDSTTQNENIRVHKYGKNNKLLDEADWQYQVRINPYVVGYDTWQDADPFYNMYEDNWKGKDIIQSDIDVTAIKTSTVNAAYSIFELYKVDSFSLIIDDNKIKIPVTNMGLTQGELDANFAKFARKFAKNVAEKVYQKGWENGYEEGYNDGYRDGFVDGYATASAELAK